MDIDYSESYIKTILSEVKTIAVVGASSKKDRDSYKVMYHLIENGYKVFPINPNESGKIIFGEKMNLLQKVVVNNKFKLQQNN